jgi:CHAT domain-containing protein
MKALMCEARQTTLVVAVTFVIGALLVMPHALAQQETGKTPRLSALLRDAETAAGLVASGKLFYGDDSEKKTWGDYCRNSFRLSERGEFRQAVREASKALFLGQDSGNATALAWANRDLAYAYSFSGDLDRAEEFAKQALYHIGRSSSSNSADVISIANKILGDIAMRRNDADVAIKHYQSAMSEMFGASRHLVPTKIAIANAEIKRGKFDVARKILDDIGAGGRTWAPMMLRARGQLSMAERGYAKAVEHYSSAIAAMRNDKDSYHLMWVQHGLARAYIALGDRDKAIASLNDALASARTLRRKFRSEEFRAGFFGDVQSIYDDAIGLLVDAGRHSDALAISEESRARALLDILRGRAREDALETNQAIASIPEGAAVAVYHTLPNRTVVWTVRRSGITAAVLASSRKEMAVVAGRFRRAVSSRAQDTAEQARRLYTLLVQPLALTADETLVVVPHGALHFVPMQALLGQQGYLIEERPVVTVPSLNAMSAIAGGEENSRRLLFALGNPDLGDVRLSLPAAEREVSEIGALFPESQVFVRAEASKPRFVRQAPGSDMIHIAAHAAIDEIDPLYSTIKLAGPASTRGDLEAHEILKLDLSKTQLVTLSACESGLGKISGGDEFYGFQRTFLAAGARTLVLSLWPVEDESTAQLMSAMYKGLQGQSVAQALRQAQLGLLKSAAHADPMFWAPFVLVGNWK